MWGWSLTLGKLGDLESPGTLECLELDSKAQNTSHWGVFSVIEKVLKRRYRKWPRIWSFGHLQPKLGAKEGPGVKLAIWLPPTKSRESTCSRHAFWECNMVLKSFFWGLQLWFRSHPARRSGRGAMKSQNPGTPTWDSFGTPLWESREKVTFRRGCHKESQSIL